MGKYLAKKFNYLTTKPFKEFDNLYNNYNIDYKYQFRGSMAYIGMKYIQINTII